MIRIWTAVRWVDSFIEIIELNNKKTIVENGEEDPKKIEIKKKNLKVSLKSFRERQFFYTQWNASSSSKSQRSSKRTSSP